MSLRFRKHPFHFYPQTKPGKFTTNRFAAGKMLKHCTMRLFSSHLCSEQFGQIVEVCSDPRVAEAENPFVNRQSLLI